MSLIEQQAAPYTRLIAQLQQTAAAADNCDSNEQAALLANERMQDIQAYWVAGLLGKQGETERHGSIEIREFGEWNRGEGPAFLRAQALINGEWKVGSIAISAEASSWSKQHWDQSPAYRSCILHIILSPAPPYWRSLSSVQEDIPVLHIPDLRWRELLSLPSPLDRDSLELCQEPLADNSIELIDRSLRAAAAYRIMRKQLLFERRAAAIGRSQCWYESWAESLGYYNNRGNMKQLARRVPLNELQAQPELIEPLLLGTAGFLLPHLPSGADDETRHYHRQCWDAWWPQREQYELSGSQALPWSTQQQRPANHPQRRVAALAASIPHWAEIENSLSASKIYQFEQIISQLRHPYWQQRSCLGSARQARPSTLIGKERLRAFYINHLLVQDSSPEAWRIYCQQKERQVPGKISRLAKLLAGDRQDLQTLLSNCYAQQGIIQMGIDFGSNSRRGAKLFPAELAGLPQARG